VRKRPVDQPDCVVSSETGAAWTVTCVLCPRTLGGPPLQRVDACWRAREHLKHTHGLDRIYVEVQTVGYRATVNVALPLVVAHDLTLPADRYTR